MLSIRAGGVSVRLIDHAAPTATISAAANQSHRKRVGVLVLRTGCAGGL
jgi:hypothetical protein